MSSMQITLQNLPSQLEQTVVSNFIEIGDKKNKRIAKGPVKPSPSPFFRVDRYKGIQVHYSVEKEFSTFASS